ncbi:MAG: PHB depolymerase family esterase [Vitreoscilla sp.]|nr:PHB depolymerase family esterase [Vitreoscilla sp.]
MHLQTLDDPPHSLTWRGRWLKRKAGWAHAGRSLWRKLRGGAAPSEVGPAVGRFTEGHFGGESPRRYMLYRPASRSRGRAPLLVLLHGCQQGAADFAAGTRMNAAAEDHGVVVLYPEQAISANVMRCWNWYGLQDRSHHGGDAALIAAMTRQVILAHDIDPLRVYVAGMSAGGGMAAVLARDYPQLFAALGVHSGVPAGLAHDVVSAMRLMASGPEQGAADAADLAAERDARSAAVATIVFHGDEDTLVHPGNGEAIHRAPGQARSGRPAMRSVRATTLPRDGQRGFTRTVDVAADGVTRRELWIVHGAGHAWAGGSAAERHTDASGPDASREMLRFFLQHRRTG